MDVEELLYRAMCFAAAAHSGQMRKSENLPYILHPMEVSTIVSGITNEPDVIIAALLHDVVEDTPGTPEQITKLFGEHVAFLVASETENKREEMAPEDSWRIRKEESLQELADSTDPMVRILWLADKLANMRSLYRSWRKIGDDAFQVFHQKEKSAHEWYYRTAMESFEPLSDTAAYAEYKFLVNEVFHEGRA